MLKLAPNTASRGSRFFHSSNLHIRNVSEPKKGSKKAEKAERKSNFRSEDKDSSAQRYWLKSLSQLTSVQTRGKPNVWHNAKALIIAIFTQFKNYKRSLRDHCVSYVAFT